MPFSSLTANGVSLSYLEEGRGAPILFVHGSLEDYRSWTLQLGDFSRSYRALAYSRRGHYPNPWKEYPSNYSVLTEKEDLLAFIEVMQLRTPLVLVGYSYGAFACVLLARDRPELVRTLVLEEPPIFDLLSKHPFFARDRESFQEKLEAAARIPLERGDYQAGVSGFLDTIMGEGTFQSLSAETREVMLQNSKTLLYEITTPERDPFPAEDARKLTMPTLLLVGQNSPKFFLAISQELSRHLPRSRLVAVPHAAHNAHRQNPQFFDETVSHFLSSS